METTAAAQTAASKAFPPSSSTRSASWEASQCAVETTPSRPITTERVPPPCAPLRPWCEPAFRYMRCMTSLLLLHRRQLELGQYRPAAHDPNSRADLDLEAVVADDRGDRLGALLERDQGQHDRQSWLVRRVMGAPDDGERLDAAAAAGLEPLELCEAGGAGDPREVRHKAAGRAALQHQ